MQITTERIRSLDGLRCIAVFAVLAFHYCAMWPALYPYGDALAKTPAQWGYFGVHLFFAVSGYVIALTLERCSSFYEFAVRRFARLWPTMLLCSVITYVVLSLVPTPFETSAWWFLPSLTFMPPAAFGDSFQWIDNAYWSLFTEVRFYAFAGLLYFSQRTRFLENATLASTLILSMYSVSIMAGIHELERALVLLGIADFLPWFLLGIAVHYRQRTPWLLVCIAISALMVQSVSKSDVALTVAAIAIPVVLWASQSVDAVRTMLSWKPITAIGVSSYSLYLLHQYIGVTIISLAVSEFGGYTLALTITAALILLAYIVHTRYETAANALIVRSMIHPTSYSILNRKRSS